MNQKVLLKGFKKPKSIQYEKDEQTFNYGKFVIFPFEKGFGHTIGNSLRRILLSSLPGYAISAIRIESINEKGDSKQRHNHIISSEWPVTALYKIGQ